MREERGWRQEDMLTHGISLRHWQRIEAGKSITVTTLLKIADAFNVPPSDLIADLYRKRKLRG
jgi:transcriptional regulator with XRE-family HTH domain